MKRETVDGIFRAMIEIVVVCGEEGGPGGRIWSKETSGWAWVQHAYLGFLDGAVSESARGGGRETGIGDLRMPCSPRFSLLFFFFAFALEHTSTVPGRIPPCLAVFPGWGGAGVQPTTIGSRRASLQIPIRVFRGIQGGES